MQEPQQRPTARESKVMNETTRNILINCIFNIGIMYNILYKLYLTLCRIEVNITDLQSKWVLK